MKKGISLKTYRFVDILFFTGLLVIFEVVASQAPSWFNEKYYISLFLSISLLVLMRWNAWSIITILMGTLMYCFLNQGDVNNYIIYGIGNLFLFLNLLWFLKGKERFKKTHIVLFYVITGYLAVEIGRSLIALFFNAPFFSTLIGFLGTDLLSFLLTILIIFIVRRQDGLFEDQITYLHRLNEKKEKDESDFEVNEYETHHKGR